MSKPPLNEKALYPPMLTWLKQYLESHYPKSQIEVYDTSLKSLATFISTKNYGYLFPPEWNSWDIHVDITGLIITGKEAKLAFIEAKDTELSLSELSQLLGYSRVVRPLEAFLLSPKGCSGSLTSLLRSYSRRDILVYHQAKGKLDRTITVAKWDITNGSIDQNSVIS